MAGGVRALLCPPPGPPLVASCGLDRFLRVHDLRDGRLRHKVGPPEHPKTPPDTPNSWDPSRDPQPPPQDPNISLLFPKSTLRPTPPQGLPKLRPPKPLNHPNLSVVPQNSSPPQLTCDPPILHVSKLILCSPQAPLDPPN